ncbi:iron complex transport system substrate-binding protein [Methanococcus voltae]|uniref:ABC transporter substrate-binding protein n=1 Tax=Methanococcus voltae TaxID=2188 RepID=UPI001AE6C03D|nr:ABC transporter substrate-binding protein [Methanococcus voltae]MBP2144414.1 iron complex transport system substrate-binding protein [Methanococcus voltae]
MNETLKKSLVTIFSIFAVVAIVMSCGCTSGATELTPVLTTDNTDANAKGSDASKTAEYMTITDMAGRTVQVPKKVDKVIGLACTLREIVYLGAKDKVMGIEEVESDEKIGMRMPYMMANPELAELPTVSKAGKTQQYYERILAANPDVIFLGNQEAEIADDMQSKLNIPVIIVHATAIGSEEQNKKYENSLRLMGKVLNKEERAEEIINKMDEYEADLKARASKSDKNPSVYIPGRAYYGTNGITTTDPRWPPFELLGANNRANNVAYGMDNASKGVSVSEEQLITWNPEYMFIPATALGMVEKGFEKAEFKELSAVKNGNVYKVPPFRLYSYNKGTAIADSYYIGKILYPEQFEDIDPIEKADEIYLFFNGGEVYDEIVKKNLGFEQLDIK